MAGGEWHEWENVLKQDGKQQEVAAMESTAVYIIPTAGVGVWAAADYNMQHQSCVFYVEADQMQK